MKVIIAGATGAVGKQIVYECLSQPPIEHVYALVRTPFPLIQDAQLEQVIIDWNHPESWPEFREVDIAFCALGTTIQKAKTKEAFKQVDYHIALSFAKMARKIGVKTMVLVSAMGANSKSAIFYSRVKGELEEAMGALGFEKLIIAQPGLIITPRKERRVGEQVAQMIAPIIDTLLLGPLARYHSVSAGLLGKALVRMSLDQETPNGLFKVNYSHFKKMKAPQSPWLGRGGI